MLEIVNQLDGFDARGNIKVRGGCLLLGGCTIALGTSRSGGSLDLLGGWCTAGPQGFVQYAMHECLTVQVLSAVVVSLCYCDRF